MRHPSVLLATVALITAASSGCVPGTDADPDDHVASSEEFATAGIAEGSREGIAKASLVKLDATGSIALTVKAGANKVLGGDAAGHLLVAGDQGAGVPGVSRAGGFVKVLTP